jgi:LuxR family maltose regulon positive regulatory protein
MRHTQLPDETIQEITTRTEGWLVGLQLLGLSLVGDTDPATLLKEISGDHRYILDFLTQEVLRRQSQDVQTFLLSTCILDRLTASLCDTVMQASGSQRMLERLEKTNLFISSLDAKRQWYRYHALFAEALHYHLEEMHADLMPTLHHRASFWYAEHGQIAQAILHALSANQWPWAANLIERYSLLSFTWGMGLCELAQFQHWLEQLPGDIMYSRPRLCLAITQFLWAIVPYTTCEVWLSTAEATLTASLTQKSEDASQPNIALEARKEQENLLGEVIAFHAFLQSYYKNESVLPSCQQALSFLSADNLGALSLVAYVQLHAFFYFF